MHITKIYDLARFIAYAGLVNFAIFMVVCGIFGGSARNGMVRSGHYFVGSHGKITEVSEGLYRLNQLHEYTVSVTLPLAVLTLVYANSIKKKAESHPFLAEDA